LKIVDGRGNRVKQKERNSRGDSGGRVVLQKETENKFSEATK